MKGVIIFTPKGRARKVYLLDTLSSREACGKNVGVCSCVIISCVYVCVCVCVGGGGGGGGCRGRCEWRRKSKRFADVSAIRMPIVE